MKLFRPEEILDGPDSLRDKTTTLICPNAGLPVRVRKLEAELIALRTKLRILEEKITTTKTQNKDQTS